MPWQRSSEVIHKITRIKCIYTYSAYPSAYIVNKFTYLQIGLFSRWKVISSGRLLSGLVVSTWSQSEWMLGALSVNHNKWFHPIRGLDSQGIRKYSRGGGGGGGGGRKFLSTVTVACEKKFAEHPDTPTLTLWRYRMVWCASQQLCEGFSGHLNSPHRPDTPTLTLALMVLRTTLRFNCYSILNFGGREMQERS